MKTRTCITRLALFAAALAAFPAQAQTWPQRPLRILVPLVSGGGMDTVTRSLALKLTDAFAQNVVVDNRPGAGSQVALEILAGSAPDGYTLMMISGTTVVHPILYKSRFDIVRDFTPVSQVTAQGYALVVHPSIPAKSAMEFVQHLRANPGKLNYASSGVGSLIHMSGELFLIATGTRMTHVPYKGMAGAYADLISGNVQSAFATIISSQVHVRNGRLRALAVTPPQRAPTLPDVPTLAEAGIKGVVVVNWYGLIAPPKTPGPVVERVAAETAKAMRLPDVTKRLIADGSEAAPSSPQAFAAHLRAEHALWAKVIKQAGIRPQ